MVGEVVHLLGLLPFFPEHNIRILPTMVHQIVLSLQYFSTKGSPLADPQLWAQMVGQTSAFGAA